MMLFFRFIILSTICCKMCFPFKPIRPCVTTEKTLDFHVYQSKLNLLLESRASNDEDNQPIVSSIRSDVVNSVTRNLMALTAALSVFPIAANARQGAFEMDLEYYLKTVANRAQGKPDSNLENSKTSKPAFASARVINKELANGVIKIIHEEISRQTGLPISTITSKVAAQMLLFLPYFKEYVPIKTQDFSDQYYFDIALYVSYLVAADLIPKSTNRVILRKAVGDNVLALLIDKKLIPSIGSLDVTTKPLLSPSVGAGKMALFAKGVKEILSAFSTSEFVSSFTVDEDDIGDKIFAESSFNEGLAVSFQFTLVGPIHLLGFLETAAADTFFHPEIIATTIASFGRSLGFKAHYEDYLVDNYYLANGIDTNIVTAQDVLIEMQIATPNSDSPDF